MEETALRRGVAEFVGAFTLIFIGGGAGIVTGHDIVAVALANGLAIGIMVSNLGHISGGHFNPAITLSFLATRRITARLAIVLLGLAAHRRGRCGWNPALVLRPQPVPRRGAARGRVRRRQGRRARGDPDLLPRLGRVRDRGRSARRVQVDRRPRDRAHDHDGRVHGRSAHGRRDEPGARVRPGAARQLLGRGLDLLRRSQSLAPSSPERVRVSVSAAGAARSSARRSPASPSRGPATPRSTRSIAARPPSASARGGSTAAACAAPTRRATRPCAERDGAARRSPCSCSRARSTAAPRARVG